LPPVVDRMAAAPPEEGRENHAGEEPRQQGVAADEGIVLGVDAFAQDRDDALGQRDGGATQADAGGEGAEPDGEGVPRGLGQMCITRPSESSAASATASDIVGCA
jgi:hypothetical protein